MQDWTFYIETYGCKVNQYESQALREAWLGLGGREVPEPQAADYLLVNSCAITARAERDARNAIYRLRRLATEGRIILTGCAAQFFGDFMPRKNAFHARPDICLKQSDKSRLMAGPTCTESQDGDFAIRGYTRGRPVVKVQDGCSQKCTYCIVPYTRGKPVSRKPDDILAECRRLFASGFCEIVISGVNLRQYGKDNENYGDFWDLLAHVDRGLAGEFAQFGRLRISSIEPAQLGGKALETLAACRMCCPHLHLSLQHASPAILKRMGRGHYSMDSIARFMDGLRKLWPIFGLGADIIAGFPNESEEDLQILLDFMESLPLTYAHVFPYSQRPGTPAAAFAGQMEKREKLRRAAMLREQAAELKKRFLQGLLEAGPMWIAPDSSLRAEGVWHGVNEYYAPCIFKAPCREHKGFVRALPKAVGCSGLEVEIF